MLFFFSFVMLWHTWQGQENHPQHLEQTWMVQILNLLTLCFLASSTAIAFFHFTELPVASIFLRFFAVAPFLHSYICPNVHNQMCRGPNHDFVNDFLELLGALTGDTAVTCDDVCL